MSARALERARLLDLIGSSWRTQAIHAMVELRLADRLASGPMTCVALAQAVAADEGALLRLLRGLCMLDLVETGGDTYRLTSMGQLLRTDREEDSLADWVRWWGGVQWTTWGKLPDAVREGTPMRQRCTDAAGYALHATQRDVAQVFHKAMAQLSAGVAPELVAKLAALAPARIVDVGGGRAELLGQLLLACPHAQGILLEQEHALAAARDHLRRLDLLARCTLLAGDFFLDVPPAADVYLLKSVLHNWDDASAARILQTCRRAMRTDATLAVIERAFDDGAPEESTVRSDLNMLVSLGGRERSVGELDALLRRCGFAPGQPVRAGEHRLILCCAA